MSTSGTLAFAGALVVIALSAVVNVRYARRRAERPARTWQIAVAAAVLLFAFFMAIVERH